MHNITKIGGVAAFRLASYWCERGDYMPIRYKLDVLEALKGKGYSTYKMRREKILGESVIQQIRNGELVSWANIERLCRLLNCQPGDIVEYEDEKEAGD